MSQKRRLGGEFFNKALLRNNGIARRLVVALIVFSAVITTVATAMELYLDYTSEIRGIDSRIDSIERVYLPSLIESVWVAEGPRVQTLLDGLLNLSDIELLEIANAGQIRWHAGARKSTRVVESTIPLVHSYRGKDITIGELHIVASIDNVLTRIFSRLAVILTSNAIRTLLVSAFFLLIFQVLVGQHLEAISAYLRNLPANLSQAYELRLSRSASGRWRPDALDRVTSALNHMRHDLSVTMSRLIDSNQRLQRTVAERDRVADELRQNQIILNEAQSLGEIGYIVADIVNNRAYWSDSLFNMRRVPRRDFFTIEEARTFIHPDDRARLYDVRSRALTEHEDFDTDQKIIRGDGSMGWERSVRRPRYDDAGNLIGFLIVVADISKRKQEELALRKWADAFEKAAFGIAIVNPQSDTVELINPAFAAMLGRTIDDAKGMSIRDAYSTEQHARFLSQKLFLESTGHIEWDTEISRKDGTVFPAHVDVSLVRDAQGTPLYRIVSAFDITERRAIEAQLRESQKMEALGQLTGGMAHDFNNLLGIVIGNLDFLRPRVSENEEISQALGDALDGALRSADLVRRLLPFARRQPLHSQIIELNSFIVETFKLLSRLLREDIEVSFDLASDVWSVTSDETQLGSCLANLATNARDAMPKGGRLAIRTYNYTVEENFGTSDFDLKPGDYAMIEVRDTGTGMSPEVTSKIFEPFYTTKGVGKGTGLGLSMVFGFLKQSGGHVDVSSEVGVGTTFRLCLPRAKGIQGKADKTLTPAPAPEPRGSETVLVVDDNEALRAITTRQLKALGYHALSANGPTAALEAIDRERIDLLLTDIVMPGAMDGLQLALQARIRQPHIKVVLTSGFPDAPLRESEREMLSDALPLFKPYRFDELARVMREALGG